MRKAGTCAYCGKLGLVTREHVVTKWLLKELRRSSHPGARLANWLDPRAPLSANPIIGEVCKDCNNRILKKLDDAAKSWFVQQPKVEVPIIEHDQRLMARWAAKVSYNSQRFELAATGTTLLTPMPSSTREWIRDGTPSRDEIAIFGMSMPPGHPSGTEVFVWAVHDEVEKVCVDWIQLRSDAFLVAWSAIANRASRPTVADRVNSFFTLLRLDTADSHGRLPVVKTETADLIQTRIQKTMKDGEGFLK